MTDRTTQGLEAPVASLATLVDGLGSAWTRLSGIDRMQEIERIQRHLDRIRHHLMANGDEPPRNKVSGLTLRERQVLALLVEGFSTAEVAGELDVSVETVRSHVKNLLSKLGVHSRIEAVALARQDTRPLRLVGVAQARTPA
jgi:DNA-binding NarL/FixJ family response regulator